MIRFVNAFATFVAGLAVAAAGCTSIDLQSWNPVSRIAPRSYSADTRLKMARVQEQQGQLAKAQQLYAELYRGNPRNAEVCQRLAVVSARMGDAPQSERFFHEALRLNPNHAELLTDYGYARVMNKDYAGAEAVLRRAVAAAPGNKRAMNNLAITLGYQGKHEQSLAMFRRVVPEAQAQANLAYLHVQRGEGKMAVDRYTKALALDKNLKSAAHALLQLAEMEQRYLQSQRGQRQLARLKAKAPRATRSAESAPDRNLTSQAPLAIAANRPNVPGQVARTSEPRRLPPETTMSSARQQAPQPVPEQRPVPELKIIPASASRPADPPRVSQPFPKLNSQAVDRKPDPVVQNPQPPAAPVTTKNAHRTFVGNKAPFAQNRRPPTASAPDSGSWVPSKRERRPKTGWTAATRPDRAAQASPEYPIQRADQHSAGKRRTGNVAVAPVTTAPTGRVRLTPAEPEPVRQPASDAGAARIRLNPADDAPSSGRVRLTPAEDRG